ncbi:hypothetical protein KFK09_012724 [Dendrobium nobile]|uniref:Uncharacterized protein n=1 Tax=Dendrobium nobile TaxID=94219 RepID=A0A8T3BG37_DENNO|nr:hypothetical protein KFK09_012724 [Dendrobium nobile]
MLASSQPLGLLSCIAKEMRCFLLCPNVIPAAFELFDLGGLRLISDSELCQKKEGAIFVCLLTYSLIIPHSRVFFSQKFPSLILFPGWISACRSGSQ